MWQNEESMKKPLHFDSRKPLLGNTKILSSNNNKSTICIIGLIHLLHYTFFGAWGDCRVAVEHVPESRDSPVCCLWKFDSQSDD